MHTLVLNADGTPIKWMPLSVTHWKVAITRYVKGDVDILHTYDDWIVHSPSTSISVPSVIMERTYVRPEFHVKFSRINVFLRDEFRCQYCGSQHDRKNLQIEHVLPRYHGGKTKWENCVAACSDCNLSKAHFLDMSPLVKPKRPNYWDMVNKRKKLPLVIADENWIPYLGWDESKLIVRKRRYSNRIDSYID